MTKAEREKRIFYWYINGIELYNKWIETKDETTYGAFICCSACAVEYDRSHSNSKTQKLQRLAWFSGFLRGETSLEEWKESGYFDEKLYNEVLRKAC